MVDYADIRDRFRAHTGGDAYSKFVAEINLFSRRADRLRYWQKQIWQTFAEREGLSLTLPQILGCFAVCHVHGCDLETDDVRIVYGTVRLDPAESDAKQRLFPMAFSVVYGGCCVEHAKTATVQYCAECRNAQQRWSDQSFKCNIQSPDSEEIRLFLIAKSSQFNADDRVSNLRRYYSTWKPPRTPKHSAIARFVDLVSEIHRMIVEAGPNAQTADMLDDAVGMFSLSITDDSDRVILDHCKMHYIAVREIHRLTATQIIT